MSATDTFDAMLYQPEIDALAEMAGVNLRVEHDTDAPMPWAIWCEIPDTGDEDLIGAGESVSEAIEAARETVRAWEAEAKR